MNWQIRSLSKHDTFLLISKYSFPNLLFMVANQWKQIILKFGIPVDNRIKQKMHREHQQSQHIASQILNDTIMKKVQKSSFPRHVVFTDSIKKVSKFTDSIMEMFDETCVSEPKKWNEEKQLNIESINFQIKTVNSNPFRQEDIKSKNSSLTSINSSQGKRAIEKNSQILQELAKKSGSKSKKPANSKMRRSSKILRYRKMIPLFSTVQRKSEDKFQIERFLRESKQNKEKSQLFITDQNSSQKKTLKRIKKNKETINRKNPLITDFDGQAIALLKLDQTKFQSHYVEMEPAIPKEEVEERKKFCKTGQKSDLQMGAFKKAKVQTPIFQQNVVLRPREGVTIKNNEKKKDVSEVNSWNCHKDLNCIKFTDFIKLKENKWKWFQQKREKERKKLKETFEDKKIQTSRKTGRSRRSILQRNDSKEDSRENNLGVKVNSLHGHTFLISENDLIPKKKKRLEFDEKFLS